MVPLGCVCFLLYIYPPAYDSSLPLQPPNRKNQESAEKVDSEGPERHGIKVMFLSFGVPNWPDPNVKQTKFLNSRGSVLGARRHLLLWHENTTRTYVFLWHKKTCLLVAQENMSSCGTTRTPQFKKTLLLYHVWETLSGPVWRSIFLKRTIFIPCVLGPPAFTFLPLWGFVAVGGHRHHKCRHPTIM